MSESADRAHEEFFTEAQELIELLSKSLLSLDELSGTGTEDPAVVNEAFRAVHTLKSLAGIFNQTDLAALAHRLEDLLDDLRLGRIALSRDLVDLLLEAVELCWHLLAHQSKGSPLDTERLEAVTARLQNVSASAAPKVGLPDLDNALLSVLTEYEEYRLRSCLAQGLSLYKVRVSFELATIDRELEAVRVKAKPLGEVITYLPTGGSVNSDGIELEILLASKVAGEELALALEALPSQIECISQPSQRLTTKGPATVLPPSASSGTHITVPPKAKPMSPVRAELPLRSVSQSVRVDIRKLDTLMNAVGELAVLKNTLARIGEKVRGDGQRALGAELQRAQRTFERRLAELQSGILEVRMVPLSQVFERLSRVVRQISRELDKEIRLVVTGGDTEIDKLIVEELSDPLVHIVRNAIDHGIEGREARTSIGKPEAGTIAINAFQKGNHVVVEVEDDGAGVNERSLLTRAVELRKLSSEEASGLTRAEALDLVFLPGLTTRDAASDVSGRGVGMDVVKTNISRLGGVIDIKSERNIGTKISLTLPITLAIVSALLVRVVGRSYAVPLSAVSEALLLNEAAIRWIDGREVLTLRGASLPLCRLQQLFLFQAPEEPPRRRYVVVASMGNRRIGLVVDDLMGQQDIVIKALGPSLANVRGFSGATEIGEHSVVLVLDVSSIVEETLSALDVRERGVSHA